MAINPYDKKFNFKEDAVTLLIIVVVCFFQALVINGMYVEHGLLSGGITGVALLLNYTFGFPSALVIIILNVPVAIITTKFLNVKIAVYSIIATVLFSAFVHLTSGLHLNIENSLLSSVCGGAIIGISSSVVVKRGATMGGTDVLAAILNRKLSIPLGTFNIMFNLVIMSVLALVKGLELSLVSMMAMFASNTAFNYAMKGLNRTHTVFVISKKWDEIAPLVLEKMKRGVTYIHAEGAYTGEERKLVYCIVKTVELSAIKRIVREHDPNALFSVIETEEVTGRGFGLLN